LPTQPFIPLGLVNRFSAWLAGLKQLCDLIWQVTLPSFDIAFLRRAILFCWCVDAGCLFCIHLDWALVFSCCMLVLMQCWRGLSTVYLSMMTYNSQLARKCNKFVPTIKMYLHQLLMRWCKTFTVQSAFTIVLINSAHMYSLTQNTGAFWPAKLLMLGLGEFPLLWASGVLTLVFFSLPFYWCLIALILQHYFIFTRKS